MEIPIVKALEIRAWIQNLFASFCTLLHARLLLIRLLLAAFLLQSYAEQNIANRAMQLNEAFQLFVPYRTDREPVKKTCATTLE